MLGDYQPDPPLRAPAHVIPELRSSTLVKCATRNAFGFVIKELEQLARLGKRRGEIVRYLLERGGRATVPELMERFCGPATRRRDFEGRTLAPMLDPAIIEVDGACVTLAGDWREALETHRTLGAEQEAARLQRAAHVRQRRAYRERRKNPPAASPTPEDLDSAREERERRRREQQQRPVSDLAAAMRIYLDKNPLHSEEPANWVTTAMWAYGWLEHNPTVRESNAAMSELAGGLLVGHVRSAA